MTEEANGEEFREFYNAFLPVICMFGDNPSDGFNGPPVTDAGTVIFHITEDLADLVPGADKYGMLLKTSLNEMVDDILDGQRAWLTGTMGRESIPILKAFAAALRAAADKAEAAIPTEEQLVESERQWEEYRISRQDEREEESDQASPPV